MIGRLKHLWHRNRDYKVEIVTTLFTIFVIIVTASTTLFLDHMIPRATNQMCRDQYDPSYFIVHAGANGGADFCSNKFGAYKYPDVSR